MARSLSWSGELEQFDESSMVLCGSGVLQLSNIASALRCIAVTFRFAKLTGMCGNSGPFREWIDFVLGTWDSRSA